MDTKNNLIRKFYYALPNNGSQEGLCSTTQRWEEAEICSEIADEFAIGFVEWYFRKEYYSGNYIKEQLKIYKEQL